MRKIIILTLIAIAALAAAFYAFYEFEKNGQRDFIKLFGNVDIRQVDLGFRVPGRVDALHFEEGDLVAPGKLVATLDKQPYLDQVREATANVESIKASLNNSVRILQRRQELITDGSVSQEDLDNAIANEEVLKANLKQAEAALAVAITNLKFTEVFAPTEGTILTRIREPGSVVNPAEPVYTLSVTSPVWIRAFVTEPELGLVFPGMVADIHTDTKDGKVYQGHVGFISPVAEFTPKTVETTQLRTDLVYRLRIYVDNVDKGLRQGMPVTVKLHIKKENQ
jgi:HlyD family secretion protein